jgi:ATP-dependent Clp protease ATP-binding subunit ClpC
LNFKLAPEAVKNIILANKNANFTDNNIPPKFSETSKNLVTQTIKIAYLNKHKYIGTEHLLVALLLSDDYLIKKILSQTKLSPGELAKQATTILKTTSKLPEIVETFKNSQAITEDIEETTAPTGPLDYFGRNLCDVKIQLDIDPVIGRESEINRIIEILCRRHKNNPLLLGDAGVGKTAIIEGLAKKILAGEVPEILLGKKIYTLDLAALVAGTSFRGEFEARLKEVLEEIYSRPEVILFIDEIHQIVGAGSASGSMDAANILKPALARGEIRIIGATTFGDFRKSLENDPALERRFQIIRVEEPNAAATKNILTGIKQFFEKFHRVTITPAAIEAAVTLSQKYLPEKFLPDKAIDLIDEAAAGIKANRRPSKTEAEIKAVTESIKKLESDLHQLIASDNFADALALKNNLLSIREQIKKLQTRADQEKNQLRGQVEPLAIARIIAKSTGIPADDLLLPDVKRTLALERELKKQIIGQDAAIASVSSFLKRARAGLSPENKPLASFLFAGPSGVGKTYLAKILARQFFGDDKALVKIDMSEYGEKFNVSKLIGAPAGYVGYKESGQLTERIKHRPYALVLFDEIEKANPEIFDLLLQVLEDGYLTDAAGAKINFNNTIIILTSNLGREYWSGKTDIGFGPDNKSAEKKTFSVSEQKTLGEIKKWFKPEFINRLDQIICFDNLTAADLEKITALELDKLGERLLKEKNLTLQYTAGATQVIAKQTQNQNYLTDNRGARGVKKTIRDLVEEPLADKLLEEKIVAGKTLRLKAKNGIINISNNP